MAQVKDRNPLTVNGESSWWCFVVPDEYFNSVGG